MDNRILRDAKAEEFDQIFSLLETSFPVDEYRPYEKQKALLENKSYSIKVVADPESGLLKAFISLWKFPGLVFVEHFAVDPGSRNQGLGARMTAEIMDSSSEIVCLEAELPETEFARRRIGFYERSGFYANEFRYIQPSYSPGRKPVPLVFLTSGGPVTFEAFSKMRDTIYREVYGCTPE